MVKKKELMIGVLSARTGCKVETIRYYERIGIFPSPPRTEGGHRSYAEKHVMRLVFIRRSRELGFSLEEIRALLGLVDSDDYTCGEVKNLTDRHLESIRGKISDLRRLEKTLAKMSSQCDGGSVPECPVIDALFDGQ